MAQGFLRSFDKRLSVFSAGTKPAAGMNPLAVEVMKDADIDISGNKPRNVDEFIDEDWDYVITVCDNARETCPYFPGKVKKRLHMGFEDPSEATGSGEEIMNEFYRVRDEIKKAFSEFYESEIKGKL